MNILIIILLIIATPIAGILVAAIFTTRESVIERDIIVDMPSPDVFDYVKMLKNQEHYSKWVMADPNMKKDFTGTDGTKGAVYAWQSNDKKVGKGEQEIIKVDEGESIEHELRFMEPFKSISQTYLTVTRISEDKTKVIWTFRSTLSYGMRVLHLVVRFDKLLGNDMAESLLNLKNILEKNAVKEHQL